MEFLFAYLAGLLTLINPCVLPILPIVLGSAVQGHRHAPLALAAGMGISFVALGLFVSTVGFSLGLDEERVAQIGALAMIGFGLILITPRLAERFELATAGLSSRADAGIDGQDRSSLNGHFITGMLLGAVWSPCVGPTLGGAIALAYQGDSLLYAAVIMVFFALGIGSVILALGYGTRKAIAARVQTFKRLAVWSKPMMGWLMVLVGALILSGGFRVMEIWLLDTLPAWLIDFSVIL